MTSTRLRRSAAALAVLTVAVLTLSGCGERGGESPLLQERTITLSDGRTITCVMYAGAGGVSCDWGSR